MLDNSGDVHWYLYNILDRQEIYSCKLLNVHAASGCVHPEYEGVLKSFWTELITK